MGRDGNSVDYHPGNEYFWSLVNQYQVEYAACSKPLKGCFPKLIVDNIYSLDPPGRFLEKDPQTNLWSEIEYKESLDKTIKALRPLDRTRASNEQINTPEPKPMS